jgi:hypothetical protein
MNTKYNTKKKLKKLKKQIVENSAIFVGYDCSILENLPSYSLLQAIKEISIHRFIKEKTDESESMNIVVTESVKAMSYQDFKKVSDFFI